jgi:hypothetical protein
MPPVTAQAAGWKQRQAAAGPAFLKKSSKELLAVLTSARPGTLGARSTISKSSFGVERALSLWMNSQLFFGLSSLRR